MRLDQDGERPTTGTWLARTVIPAVVVAVISWGWVHTVGLDHDEGLYLSAARMVSKGKLPYSDFFYPQAPLMPLLWAPLLVLTGFTLESARLINVVLLGFAAAGFSLAGCAILPRRTGPWQTTVIGWAVAGASLLHPLVLFWSATFKPYALVIALSAWSLHAVIVALTPGSSGRRPWFSAGVLATLAVSAKLYLLPLLGGATCALLLRGLRERRHHGTWPWLDSMRFGLGCSVASLPALAVSALDPLAAWFHNVGYHRLISELRIQQGWPTVFWDGKLAVLAEHWHGHPATRLLTYAIAGALAASVLGSLTSWLPRLRSRSLQRTARSDDESFLSLARAAFLIIVMVDLGIVLLFMQPFWEQYLVTCLALAPCLALALATTCASSLVRRVAMPAVAIAALAGAAWHSEPDRVLRADGWDPSLAAVAELADAARAASAADEPVLAFFPPYAIQAGRDIPREMVGGLFALRVSPLMKAGERRRFNLPDLDMLNAWLVAGHPRVVVTGVDTPPPYKDLSRFGHQPVFRNDQGIVWSAGDLASSQTEQ